MLLGLELVGPKLQSIVTNMKAIADEYRIINNGQGRLYIYYYFIALVF